MRLGTQAGFYPQVPTLPPGIAHLDVLLQLDAQLVPELLVIQLAELRQSRGQLRPLLRCPLNPCLVAVRHGFRCASAPSWPCLSAPLQPLLAKAEGRSAAAERGGLSAGIKHCSYAADQF